MASDFYRKAPQRRWWKEKFRTILKNRRLALVLTLGLMLFVYVLVNNKGVITRIRLELQYREVVRNVKEAEEETKHLQAQLKALEGDKETIEKIARERYGMARKGETVYRIKKN
jgi:cell division protein FtsB